MSLPLERMVGEISISNLLEGVEFALNNREIGVAAAGRSTADI